MPTQTPNSTPPSIGKPYGVGAPGGGGSKPWATDTKLINTNKIEANILLFCIIFMDSQMYKKNWGDKIIHRNWLKKHPLNTKITDEKYILLFRLVYKNVYFI